MKSPAAQPFTKRAHSTRMAVRSLGDVAAGSSPPRDHLNDYRVAVTTHGLPPPQHTLVAINFPCVVHACSVVVYTIFYWTRALSQ